MNESVKLRKSSKERSVNGPLYLGRPKSWGEFQSSLTTFHSVQGPRRSKTSPTHSNQDIEASTTTLSTPRPNEEATFNDVVLRKNPADLQENANATKPVRSELARPRPLSEVSMPTPFYRRFQAHSGAEAENVSKSNHGNDNDPNENISNLKENPELEEALKVKSDDDSASSALVATNGIFPSHTSGDVTHSAESSDDEVKDKLNSRTTTRNRSPEGSTVRSDLNDLSLKDTNNNSKVISVVEKSEALLAKQNLQLFDSKTDNVESDGHDPPPVVEFDDKLNSESAGSVNNIDFETSSALDTEFDSSGEKRNLQDFNLACESKDMGTPMRHLVVPVKPHSGVSSSLRSCYHNNFAGSPRLSSSSSKTSFSSLDASGDDEIESSSPGNAQHSTQSSVRDYDSDRTKEDGFPLKFDGSLEFKSNLSVSDRITNDNVIKTKSKSSKSFARKSLESDVTGSAAISQFEPPGLVIKNGSLSRRHLGWRDDQSAPIGVANRAVPGSVGGKEIPYHGTWPRKAFQSKRKQEQQEAEELLRRFRDTSESHRSRFRDIYAESRRKIDEMMFGLRLAMAKNGYGAKFYQSKDSELT